MATRRYFLRFVAFLFVATSLQAQPNQTDIVQIFGLIKSQKGGATLSLATVLINQGSRATFTTSKGVFSIVAKKGDTLHFSYVGYKPTMIAIPKDFAEPFYYADVLMEEDVIELPDFVADYLPTRDQFERDFVHMDFEDDMTAVALKNLDPKLIKRLMVSLPIDGGESAKMALDRQMQNYVYYRQQPTLQIFNPFAWYQFIKQLKSGEITFK